jgi:hypothetical protein
VAIANRICVAGSVPTARFRRPGRGYTSLVSDTPPGRSAPVLRFNGGRALPPDPDAPFKHVIEQYQHDQLLVTCVCGWLGSTATPHGEKSAWDLHKASFRVGKR